MNYNFAAAKEKIKGVEEWLKKEYNGIRTGRASPSLLDGVMVESYGARVPLSQVGSITAEDARMLRIVPWDMGQVKEIEKAITAMNLGVSPVVDDKGVRVAFPELTADRRVSLMKIAKQKLEEARVSLRAEREKAWSDIQAKEKNDEITEDDKFRLKKEMEKIIEEGNGKLDEVFARKEKEISS